MTPDHPITIGIFDGYSWIRCIGKGSFKNSPCLKEFADQRIQQGERLIVIDLAACTGMDSTFMGTLAGIASRLSAFEGAAVHIANADDRNRRSLEDLGLDFLLEINPDPAPWLGHIAEIRQRLVPAPSQPTGKSQNSKLVLDAHLTLSDLNDQNAKTFSNVIQLLHNEVPPDESQKI